MHVSELDTPALLIDLDIFERNLARVADYARTNNLRLRPHTKTHKSPEVGRRQLQSGAIGLTVAKTGEAEVMLSSGTPDLLVAYPVIGARKLARLMKVAERARLTIALDNLQAIRELSEAATAAGVAVGVLVETDVGLGRVGVAPGEDLIALARAVRDLPGITLEGVTFYPGHIKRIDEAGIAALEKVGEIVMRIRADFKRAGLPLHIVSGGSTPALYESHRIGGLTEIRPGTYVYNDINTVLSGACGWDDCAATILCTVVSTAVRNQMILDGGSKTFSSDRLGLSSDVTFGRVVEAPSCSFHKMNEEHGYVDVSNAERQFQVGDRVHVIPNHVCVAVNLHECVYGVRGETVEAVWKVEGRGKLQ